MNSQKAPNKNIKKPKQIPNKFNKLLLFAPVLITFLVYYQSLNNKLIGTWDDNQYITENNFVQSNHGDSAGIALKSAFSINVAGNYHPLTMLSFWYEYGKHKLDPKPYHVDNLILHLLNTLLVFCFIWLLTKQQWVAFFTSLLFAIHPMHVESVAWVSERKDLLYSFFYLSAICFYLLFLKSDKRKILYYLLIVILFVASSLSKGMAVSLPIALFSIDYFIDRKFTKKTILEKIPLILISVIFGYIAINAQKSADATVNLNEINLFGRMIFPCFGLLIYLFKLIAPFNLTCHYNYPIVHNGSYPGIFYLAPILLIVVAILVYRSKRFGKDILFGFGFFMITIALVLQFLPVGGAMLAERYSYIPYIGLFFILARLVNNFIIGETAKAKKWKTPVLAGMILFSLVCSVLTYQRTKVWENDFTLWNDAIKKEPDNKYCYNSRGDAFLHLKQYDDAILDYNAAIKFNFPNAYYNRGLAYYNLKKTDEALHDFSKSIELNPTFGKGYSMRAIIYTDANNFDAAINDYNKAIQYQPTNAIAFHNRGILFKKNNNFTEALENFNTAIQLNPNYAEAYNNRGVVYRNLQKNDEALVDFNKAIEIQPDFARPYYFRGMLEYDLGKKEIACTDIQKAAGLGFQMAIENYNKMCR